MISSKEEATKPVVKFTLGEPGTTTLAIRADRKIDMKLEMISIYKEWGLEHLLGEKLEASPLLGFTTSKKAAAAMVEADLSTEDGSTRTSTDSNQFLQSS